MIVRKLAGAAFDESPTNDLRSTSNMPTVNRISRVLLADRPSADVLSWRVVRPSTWVPPGPVNVLSVRTSVYPDSAAASDAPRRPQAPETLLSWSTVQLRPFSPITSVRPNLVFSPVIASETVANVAAASGALVAMRVPTASPAALILTWIAPFLPGAISVTRSCSVPQRGALASCQSA
jgi:hypothetical protein